MTGKLPKNTSGLRKGGGRPKGVPNKLTGAARDVIQAVAVGLGGADRMMAWAKEAPDNEKAFWVSIYPRLLPVQLTGKDDGPIKTEEVGGAAKLEAFLNAVSGRAAGGAAD